MYPRPRKLSVFQIGEDSSRARILSYLTVRPRKLGVFQRSRESEQSEDSVLLLRQDVRSRLEEEQDPRSARIFFSSEKHPACADASVPTLLILHISDRNVQNC